MAKVAPGTWHPLLRLAGSPREKGLSRGVVDKRGEGGSL